MTSPICMGEPPRLSDADNFGNRRHTSNEECGIALDPKHGATCPESALQDWTFIRHLPWQDQLDLDTCLAPKAKDWT